MKKLYTLISLMLLFVGSAWGNILGDGKTVTLGEQVTSVSDITTGTYILANAKTKMYYSENAAGNAIVMSNDVTQYSAVYIKVTTNDNADPTCTIQAYSGNYYNDLKTSSQIKTSTSSGIFTILTPTKTSDLTDQGIWFKNGNNYINRSDDNTQGTGYTGTGAYSRQYVYKANIVDAIDVTYRVVNSENENDVWASEVITQADGAAVLDKKSDFTHDFVKLSDSESNPTTISAENNTVTYIGTSTTPFTASTSFDDATWYYIKGVQNGKYLYYSANSTSTPIDGTSQSITATEYHWAFLGNPIDGYQIINKAAGDGSYMYFEKPSATGQTPYMQQTEQNPAWAIYNTAAYSSATSSQFSFGYNGYYWNDQSVNNARLLSFWNGNGVGNAFTAEKVPTIAELKEEATVELSNYVTNLPLLFDSDALTTATTTINTATVSDYESVFASAKTTFMQSAAGKQFTLYPSNDAISSGRSAGYLYDNSGKLNVKDFTYDNSIVFQFVTTSTGIALQNVGTSNYVQSITQSQQITTGTETADMLIYAADANLVAIGVGPNTSNNTWIHDGSGNVVGWTAAAGASQWIIESIEDVAIEKINARIGTRWGEYAANDEFNNALEAFKNSPTAENYNAAMSVTLTNYVSGPSYFVNIANNKIVGYSMGLKTDDESGHIHAQTTNLNDVSQLWLITVPSAGTVNLFNVNAQKYVGSNVGGGSNTIALSETAVNWGISWQDDGTFILTSGSGTNDHMNFETGTGNYGNLNHWSGNDKWAATKVAEINLPVHAVNEDDDDYYATACYPFEITLPTGVTAYTATLNGNYLTLENGSQTVEAGKPVIIIADKNTAIIDDSKITVNIASTYKAYTDPTDGNVLKGTYLPKTISAEDNVLTLGRYKEEGASDYVAGFYHWASSSTNTFQNKAYYEYTSTGSKGFAFSFGGDDDPTGISEDLIREAVKELQGQRYNVQGQPVGADYKGIVIQGGKKYLQK